MSDFSPTKFANLNAWLAGAQADHPILVESIDDDCLAPLDQMIADLEAAQPLRLTRKRRDFGALKSLDALIQMRAELLAGSLLSRANIGFEFAAKYPDLVLSDGNGGIEIGTRQLDGPRRLFDRLTDFAKVSMLSHYEITLNFDLRVLKIADVRIAEVIHDIAESAAKGAGGFRADDIGLTVEISDGPGLVTMFNQGVGASLNDHVQEIIREFRNKITEKRRQAAAMPTFLLLEFSRVGDAWMVANSTWALELQRLLDDEAEEDVSYSGFGLIITSLDEWRPRKLAAVVRSDGPAVLHRAFSAVRELIEPRDPVI